MHTNNFKEIYNDWNLFLESNIKENNFSFENQIKTILENNEIFIPVEDYHNHNYYKDNFLISENSLLTRKDLTLKDKELNEAVGIGMILVGGFFALPTAVKLIGAVQDYMKGSLDMKSALQSAREDYGHRVELIGELKDSSEPFTKANFSDVASKINLAKLPKDVDDKTMKYLGYNLEDALVFMHSEPTKKKKFNKDDKFEGMSEIGRGVYLHISGGLTDEQLTPERVDKDIEEAISLHDRKQYWGNFRKFFNSVADFLHHSVQWGTELLPKLLVKHLAPKLGLSESDLDAGVSDITQNAKKEGKRAKMAKKQAIYKIIGNILHLIFIGWFAVHGLHSLHSLSGMLAGAEGTSVSVHAVEGVIETIETFIEIAFLITGSERIKKIYSGIKDLLENSAIVSFIEKCAKGTKVSVRELAKLLKNYFGKFLKKINLGLTASEPDSGEESAVKA